MAMPPSPPLHEPSPMSPTTTPLIWEDASRGRILITADLEQRLPQITQSLLQVLLSPPPPRRLRRRPRDGGGAGFPPPRILSRSALRPRSSDQRRQRRQRRRGRRTLRRDVVARQSDETGGGLERRQGRQHSLVPHWRSKNRLVNLYHNGRLLGDVLDNILDDVFLVIIGNALGFECGFVELEGDRLASVGEDEILHRLGAALDLDGVPRDLAWPLGVFGVSPLGPLVVKRSK